MRAVFHSLEWEKSSNVLVKRKPNERKPIGAIKKVGTEYDGTQVYLVPQKSKYILTVKAEDAKTYSEDLYGIIKYYNPKVRITKTFRADLEEYLKNQSYTVNRSGIIDGLYRLVEEFLKAR